MFASKRQTPDFYDRVEKIPGWLNATAGHRTRDILSWQAGHGIAGNLLEIGVFCGKYFALLVEAARRDGDRVLGIDTFEFSNSGRVRKELEGAFGEDVFESYSLWTMASSTVKPRQIVNNIGAPRFISIDGAHDHENVYRDLTLSAEVLSPQGIIAVDDFLNPKAMGVNQAVNAFLSHPRSVVPVAYISNKLFLAHCSHGARYHAAIEAMIMAGDDPQSDHFRKMLRKDRGHVEQPLFGHPVLLS